MLDPPRWDKALDWQAGTLQNTLTTRLGTVQATPIPAGILLHGSAEDPLFAVTARSLAPDPNRLTVIVPDSTAARSLHTLIDALPPQARERLRLVMPDRGLAHATSLLNSLPDIKEVVAATGPVTLSENGHAHTRNRTTTDPETGRTTTTPGQWLSLTRTQQPTATTPGQEQHTLSAEPIGALHPSPGWDQVLTTGERFGLLPGTERIPAGLTLQPDTDNTTQHPTATFDATHLLPDPDRATIAVHHNPTDPRTRERIETLVRELATVGGTRNLRLAWNDAATGHGATFLQHLADRYQLDITAPTGKITVLDSGATMVTGGGQWTRFRPHQPTHPQGPLHPAPSWDTAVHNTITQHTTGTGTRTGTGTVRRIPAGLQLDTHDPHTTTHPIPDLTTLAPTARGPVIAITADPTHPTTHTTLNQLLHTLTQQPNPPDHVHLLLTHPNAHLTHPGQPAADTAHHLLQTLADTHHLHLHTTQGTWTPTTTPTWTHHTPQPTHTTPNPITELPETAHTTPNRPGPAGKHGQEPATDDHAAAVPQTP
ncbi:hypothetical protein ACFXJ7_42620, partial [Kitasatospora indigofera]